MRTKEEGITLIALVITIIVLLILAGVSISLVIGNNGVLINAKNSVEKNSESKALEEVKMAWASATTDYWNDWTKNSSTVISEAFYEEKLNVYLEDTKADEPDSVKVTDNGDETYTVIYKTKDQGKTYIYLASKDGKVEQKIGLSLSSTELILSPTETAILTVEPEENINWVIEEGTSNITLSATKGKSIIVTAVENGNARIRVSSGDKSQICNVIVASKLVNVAKTGDYVNINIGYIDQMDSTKDYRTDNIGIAWRVLNRDTTTGVVKLISTGHPLKFYNPYMSDNTNGTLSVSELQTIENGSITIQTSSSARGYQANGFSTNNIVSLFNNTVVFDGIILPVRDDFKEISDNHELRVSGSVYWLGEACLESVWRINRDGSLFYSCGHMGAVRPVVCLKSAIIVKDGDGKLATPFRLNGIEY